MNLTSNKNFPIVGIGASAGGLEAFIQLLAQMPTDTGMAFVLVQHLDPAHPSLSVEIISRSTRLPLEEVKNGTYVQPNHVYVIPPNYSMEIADGVLNLSLRKGAPNQHMGIDLFFHSLATSEKRRAIGVVLSGTGSDGTLGLLAIKAAGGITFAQEPKSAKFDGMPTSAIASEGVDVIATPADIATELARMASHPYLNIKKRPLSKPAIPKPESDSTSRTLQEIFNLLQTRTKVDFSHYKQTTIRRRIHRRMMVHRSKNLQDYARYIETHDQEVHALYIDILINVTEFFRDPESYKALTTEVFPGLVKNRASGAPIRIWVAGCSTGEEVYSIAICLIEFLGEFGKQYPIQIFATDISEQALAKARTGQYPESALQQVSAERLERFFDKVAGGYKIHKMIRDVCLFSRHDVTSDPPFARLDMVSCRNLLIYFSTVLQKRALQMFHYALHLGGFLWLGNSENPGEFSKLFSIIDKTHKVYAKSNVQTPGSLHFPSRRDSSESAQKPQNLIKLNTPENNFENDADKFILAKFGPPGVVVNSDLEVLQFRGRTVPFLEPATGKPSQNLLKMVRPELVAALRITFQAAKKANISIAREGLYFEADRKHTTLDIEVVPTNPDAEIKNRTFLVLFKETADLEKIRNQKLLKTAKGSKKTTDRKDRQIIEFAKELAEVKDYQQALIEQYEASQEELITANEELQSTNEEFQSTNEEIETAKEELQSTNEELVTVNDELQIRNNDLTVLSSDLNNLLASIEMPLLIVGSDHCIRIFSPKAKNAFNLIPTDVGRPISDIKPNFNLNLKALLVEVSETLSPREIELQDLGGRWIRTQIRPYRNIDNKIEGAIITVVDIDMLKQKELRTKENLEYITSVAETVPLPLVVVNHEFHFQSANRSFHTYFNVPGKPVGRDIFAALDIHGPFLRDLRQLLSQAMKENRPFTNFEIDCAISGIGMRRIMLSGGKIHWSGAKYDAALISFTDITEQRHFNEELQNLLTREKEARTEADRANRAKDLFLATLSHELRTPLSPILTWAQLISHGKVDFEKAKEGAVIIEQSAKAQSQLIDDLLDISRIIMGKLALSIQTVNPGTIVLLATESVQALAEKKAIHIDINLDAKPALIHADPIRLQQIIWNLLTNAIKFSLKKSHIQVKLEYIEKNDKSFAQIQVSDQGKGIPSDFLPHIFSQFSQADSSSTRIHGGLGLGLSIVHNLVELQGGTVKAENAIDGKGAVFTLNFPLIPDHPTAIVQTELVTADDSMDENHENKSAPDLEGMRVLLVDDDESTREALSIYLRSFGANVKAAESAHEALETLPDFKPDVMITDIAMPGEDGYGLIHKVRTLNTTQNGNVPAIALTAYATSEDAKRALTAGFQAHLAKPVEANELARTILKVSRQN